jgi:hypothetical protein
MNDTYLKFITEMGIDEGEILLFPITSEEVENRTNKTLSEQKLYRVFIALCSVDSIREHINKAIDEAVALAEDDTEPIWEMIDDKYEEEINN